VFISIIVELKLIHISTPRQSELGCNILVEKQLHASSKIGAQGGNSGQIVLRIKRVVH